MCQARRRLLGPLRTLPERHIPAMPYLDIAAWHGAGGAALDGRRLLRSRAWPVLCGHSVLERLGVVVHTHLGYGPAAYQLASHAHAHFICEQCSTRSEAPDELFGGLTRMAKSRLGFSIDPCHFANWGRCAAPRARELSSRSVALQVAWRGLAGTTPSCAPASSSSAATVGSASR